MNTEDKDSDPILDRAISEIRDESIDPAEVRAAADCVWARLSNSAPAGPSEEIETIRTCADFQALLPAFRDGRLSSARAMLVEDHLHECAACRKALEARPRVETIPIRKPAAPIWKWAVAAAMLVAVGLSGYLAYDRFAPGPAGPRATVYAADGVLYKVSAGVSTPLAAGATAIEGSESVRTAKGSGAVIRLRDGSLIEMRERTEFSLDSRRRGVTINLAGGSIIVQAAKQRWTHLYVSTEDCLVSVTGTVFSVNHGVKGSRVSVIEGEVRVEQGNRINVLHSGDQVATAATLTPVPVRDEIAWSRNYDRHVALLNEFSKLQKKLEAMPGPPLRYSSRLLELVPGDAVFFASIPNLGPTLTETNRVFHEQIEQSEVLRQWWAEKMKTPENEAKLEEMLSRVRAFSDYLGPEAVVTLSPDAAGRDEQPLFLAEVTRGGFREFLEQQIAKISAESGGKAHIRIVDDPAQAVSAGNHDLLVWLGDGLLAVSSDPVQLRKVASGGGSASEFKTRIAAAYAQGVSWLFCADMHTLISKSARNEEGAKLSGFGDVRYLIAQRKDVDGRPENSAVLSFAQPRRSIASWLAAPAPMRSLNYISSDATLAVAALAKNPGKMLEDVATVAGSKYWTNLSEFEAKTGVNFAQDLVAPLGGEIAFAIDGPVLPMPSWKLLLEVNDPERFVDTLGKLAATANSHGHAGMEPLRLDKQPVNGRMFYTLTGGKPGFAAHFVFDDGLLIAAPSRDLLLRALQYRATGYSIARSQKFTALLPHDGHTNFSAMVYHNLGTLAEPLQGAVQLPSAPALILAYGEPDSIQLASRDSFFGLRLEQLLGLSHKDRRRQ
jgi:hypothetical protein